MSPKKRRLTANQRGFRCDTNDVDTENPSLLGRSRLLRGKRGGLKDMPNMPIDIIVEILLLLDPSDLINLARTTKSFRTLLMNHRSAYIWRNARSHLAGFPDCPPHLSEPAYANLAFSPHCHSCLKDNVRSILWEFNARYCLFCRRKLTRAFSGHFQMTRRLCVTHVLLPISCYNTSAHSEGKLYHIPQIQETVRTLDALSGNQQAYAKFVEERTAYVKQVQEHALLCRNWESERTRIRAQELETIRERRLDSIVARLQECGWGEEAEDLKGTLRYHKYVREASGPLSDRSWRKMQDDLVSMMRKHRRIGLLDDGLTLPRRLKHLSTAISVLGDIHKTALSECLPTMVDYAMMSEFDEIIFAHEDEDDDVTLDRFLLLSDAFPNMNEHWQAVTRRQLTALMASCICPTPDIDPLSLAVVVFECTLCNSLLHYPDVLAHSCLRSRQPPFRSSVAFAGPDTGHVDSELYMARFEESAMETLGCSAWSPDALCMKVEMARDILNQCGVMVDRTTCTQMDEMDLQIVYTSHDLDAIMTWRQALNFAHKQNLPQGSSWRVATEDEKAMVSDLHAGQLSEKARTVYEQQPLWCCAYCNSTDGYKQRLQAVVAHQKDGHPQAVSSTVGSGDIYLHPDGKRQSPFAVFMKAEGSSPIEPQIIRLGSDYILLCPKI